MPSAKPQAIIQLPVYCKWLVPLPPHPYIDPRLIQDIRVCQASSILRIQFIDTIPALVHTLACWNHARRTIRHIVLIADATLTINQIFPASLIGDADRIITSLVPGKICKDKVGYIRKRISIRVAIIVERTANTTFAFMMLCSANVSLVVQKMGFVVSFEAVRSTTFPAFMISLAEKLINIVNILVKIVKHLKIALVSVSKIP